MCRTDQRSHDGVPGEAPPAARRVHAPRAGGTAQNCWPGRGRGEATQRRFNRSEPRTREWEWRWRWRRRTHVAKLGVCYIYRANICLLLTESPLGRVQVCRRNERPTTPSCPPPVTHSQFYLLLVIKTLNLQPAAVRPSSGRSCMTPNVLV